MRGVIHPQAQTLIADELCDTKRLIDCCILLWRASYLVLVDEHGLLLFSPLLCYNYTTVLCCISPNRGVYHAQSTNQYLSYRETTPPTGKTLSTGESADG